MKKLCLLTLMLFLLSAININGVLYKYEPEISRLDRVLDYTNFSGVFYTNGIVAGEVNSSGGMTLNGVRITDWPASSPTAGDKWIDGGSYLEPNSTFAANVIVHGYVNAESFNVSYESLGGFSMDNTTELVTEEELSENLSQFFPLSDIPTCDYTEKVTADGSEFTCIADFINTTEEMQDSTFGYMTGSKGITGIYTDEEDSYSIMFNCNQAMDNVSSFDCDVNQKATIKGTYIKNTNTTWLQSWYGINGWEAANQSYSALGGFSLTNLSGSSNITISSTGQISINMSLSSTSYTPDNTIINASRLDNGSIIRYTNTTWLQSWYGDNGWEAANQSYSALGGFSLANLSGSSNITISSTGQISINMSLSSTSYTPDNTLINASRLDNGSIIRYTNTTWLQSWYNPNGYMLANFTVNLDSSGVRTSITNNITMANTSMKLYVETVNTTQKNYIDSADSLRLQNNTDAKLNKVNMTQNSWVMGNLTVNGFHIDKINSTHWKLWG